jgi:iron complex outermembrane recepter protein
MLPFAVLGQQKPGKLSGQIVDNKNKPVPYATVTLLSADSSIVNGDLTKEDGSFNIDQTGIGKFMLRINILGYKERYIGDIEVTAEAQEKKLGKLAVTGNTQSLSEVQVVGEKAMMEMSVDKKVFNVEKNITAAGGSATDVLKNIPSLAVDVDGDILLRGKETTLLIDGKPATLLGGDIASALQSLPASGIQSIEVITNPSARFDAQGMAGIINIITKRDNRFGINGSASLGAGTRDKYNGALNLNLKNNKWNLFLNSSFRRNRNYNRTANELHAADGSIISASYEDGLRIHGGFFNTLGAEYTINDKSTITLTQNLNKMQWGGNGVTRYVKPGIDSLLTRENTNLGSPFSSSTSLDYRVKFKRPKQELTTNVTFAKFWVHRDQEFVTSHIAMVSGSEVPYNTTIQRAPGGGGSTSLNGQADFTTPFLSKDGRLDAGWKTQLFWFESSNNATISTDSGYTFTPDVNLQNDYNYSQQIHAAYASYNDQKGKIGYQGGLRLEYSDYVGTSSLIGNQQYSNSFLGLFPSAYLSYKLPSDQAIYLSYTRRTNRPGFFQLMPYIDASNPMDTSTGNPSLIPEFIHNSELNYSRQFKKGHTVMASIYYQYSQNLIDRVRIVSEATGNAISKPQNLESGTTYGVELTGKAQILPIWDATVNFNFFRNEINGTNINPSLSNSGTSWFTKFNSNIKLPADFSVQLSGSYEAPKVSSQSRVLEAYWVDVAVRKNLWKNKAALVLNVSDIFNTRKYTNIYDLSGRYQTIYRDRETRVGNITFTYRFGKSDARSARRRQQNGQAPVKERDNIKQGDDSEGGF